MGIRICVIRNSQGEVQVACSRVDQADLGVSFAEAKALLRGLELALKHGFLRLEVESDCLSVINIISGAAFDDSYLGLIVHEILSIAQSFEVISFKHIFREANSVAHSFAKYAAVNQEAVWVRDVPNCFHDCIHSDILACLFE